jgi:hypothetical protein
MAGKEKTVQIETHKDGRRKNQDQTRYGRTLPKDALTTTTLMNYASYRTSKREIPKILSAVCAQLKKRFPKLNPSFNLDEGVISFKESCIMPFYIERGQITFASVAAHGMRRQLPEDSPWREYEESYLVLDGITYLNAYVKALLCEILDQPILDEGIGEYRENPRAKKFRSLANWREAHDPARRKVNPYPKNLVKWDQKRTLKQDKKFLPELL